MASIRDRAAMYQAAAEETAKFGDLDAAPPPREFMPTKKEALHVDLGDSPVDDDEVQLSAVARAAQRYQMLVENLRKDQDKPGLMEELERSREKMHSEKKDDQAMHSARRSSDAKAENEYEAAKAIVDGEPEIVSEVGKNEEGDRFNEDSFSEDYNSEGVVQMDELNDDCDFDNDAVQVDEEEQLPADTTKPLPPIAPVLSAYSAYSSELSSSAASVSFSSPSQNALTPGTHLSKSGASFASRSHITGVSSSVVYSPEPLKVLDSQTPQPQSSVKGVNAAGSSAEPSPRGVDEASFSSITSSSKRQSTRESVPIGADDDAARERWRNERSAKLPKAKVVIARRRDDVDDLSDSDDAAAPQPTTRRLIKEYKDPAELLEGRVSLVDLVQDEDGSVRRRENVAFDEFGEMDAFAGGIDLGDDDVEIDPEKHYAGNASKQKYRRRLFGAGAQGAQDRHAVPVGASREEREKRKHMQFARRSSVVSGAIDRVSMAADPFIDFMSSHNPAPVAKARGPFSKLWHKLFKRHRNQKADLIKGS